MDVSVVVTLLNEEGSVEELHRRIAASLDGREWEAIYVDDGSTDTTPAKLRALHEADPHATSASTLRCTRVLHARAARTS